MQRILALAAALVLFAGAATAAPAPGSYTLNAAGKCMGPAPKTTFAKQSLCATPAAPAPSKVCGKSQIAANKTCHK